uniref:Uncharacterized protein n=1 Tax=Rhizophora mucronata TaxID=61149 RepID=A0A2P2QTV5_RHIMU
MWLRKCCYIVNLNYLGFMVLERGWAAIDCLIFGL